jgi:hypothetical protein
MEIQGPPVDRHGEEAEPAPMPASAADEAIQPSFRIASLRTR